MRGDVKNILDSKPLFTQMHIEKEVKKEKKKERKHENT